jgi:hypothetical protein
MGKKSGQVSGYKYYGTGACAFCAGPVDRVIALYFNDEPVDVNHYSLGGGKFTGSWPEGKPGYIDLTNDWPDPDVPMTFAVSEGAATFYYGGENQPADATINRYAEHPPYKGLCYIVLADICCGDTGQLPNITAILYRKSTHQLIVAETGAGETGDTASMLANPAAIFAELLTAWHCLGWPLERINTASLQALAAELAADENLRKLSYAAPLLSSGVSIRDILNTLCSTAELWIRAGSDGRLEFGRWKWPAAPLTTLDASALTAIPELKTGDMATQPNTFHLEFPDVERAYKNATATTINTTLLRLHGETREERLNFDHTVRADQILAIGAEIARRQARVPLSVSLKVRRARAVNPDGAPIRPGDHFMWDSDPIPGGEGLARLMRCTARQSGPEGPVTLEAEVDQSAQAVPYSPDFAENPPAALVIPPVRRARILSLNIDPDSAAIAILPLIARPHNRVTRATVSIGYDGGAES